MGAGRHARALVAVARPRGRDRSSRVCCAARTARSARRRRRAGLSVARRNLRARAARSAAVRHAGRRRRRLRLRRSRARDGRRAGRAARRRRRARDAPSTRVLDAPVRWGAPATAAAGRVRASYSGDVVCAQLEQLYGEMVTAAMNPEKASASSCPVHNGAASLSRRARGDRRAGRRPPHGNHRRRRWQPRRFGGPPAAARRASARSGIIAGEGRGAAAAINTGVRAARFPIICQVDQDVVLKPGWMRRLAAALDDPAVGAAQGYYASDPRATLCARAMGLDLEQRYAAMAGSDTDHVCTGNSAYRADALRGSRPVRRDARLRIRQRHQLSAEGGRLPAAVLPGRAAASIGGAKGLAATWCSSTASATAGSTSSRSTPRVCGRRGVAAPMMLHPLVMALALAGAVLAALAAAAGASWLPSPSPARS